MKDEQGRPFIIVREYVASKAISIFGDVKGEGLGAQY